MTLSLPDQFVLFSKFGDAKADGKTITLSQTDKWLKQALILDGRKVTVTDTGIVFNKFKSRQIGYNDFLKFIEYLAQEINMEAHELRAKLVGCGPPGASKLHPVQK